MFLYLLLSWLSGFILYGGCQLIEDPKKGFTDLGFEHPPSSVAIRERILGGGDTTLQEKDGMDVSVAVVNTTAIMPCRPDKTFSEATAPNNIMFLWRRSEKPTYLTFNYLRISQDKRYQVLMADFNEFKMDLQIHRVKADDEGEYICLYRGAKMVHKKHIYLKILIPSAISEDGSSPSTVIVREGVTQKLTCNVTGAPKPRIQWFQGTTEADDMQLISTLENPRFVLSRTSLVITNVTRDLRGMYTCVAYNGVQTNVSRVIRLDVFFHPVIEMASTRIHQSLFQTTMIMATVTGNPIYSLYWELNRKPLRSVSGDCTFTLSGDKYCVMSDRAVSNPMVLKTKLTIYNLTLKDYGVYTCIVHSPFGSVNGSTEVIEKKTKMRDSSERLFPGSWTPNRKPQGAADVIRPRKITQLTSPAHRVSLGLSLSLVCLAKLIALASVL